MKEIKENSRMGKTRNFFKKFGDTKGIREHVPLVGTIKDRNVKDLTETEEIKRWQEYTELLKKNLNNLGTHDGVVTHLQSDILECEVKWTLGSITLNKDSAHDFKQFSCS